MFCQSTAQSHGLLNRGQQAEEVRKLFGVSAAKECEWTQQCIRGGAKRSAAAISAPGRCHSALDRPAAAVSPAEGLVLLFPLSRAVAAEGAIQGSVQRNLLGQLRMPDRRRMPLLCSHTTGQPIVNSVPACSHTDRAGGCVRTLELLCGSEIGRSCAIAQLGRDCVQRYPHCVNKLTWSVQRALQRRRS